MKLKLLNNLVLTIFLIIFIIACQKYDNVNKTGLDTVNKTRLDTVNKNTVDSLLIKSDSIKESSLTVIGVGDIMMGSNYPSNSLPPDDGKNIFLGVNDILTNADITTGNLEGTLLDSGGDPKICDGCVAFRTPTHYAKYLKEAGFSVMNLANNQSNDMGPVGKKSTKTALEDSEIKYFGLRESPTTIIDINNVKIGFAGFARNYLLNEPNKAAEVLKDLRTKVNILIISVHSGAEGPGAQHVTKQNEVFMGEERGNIYEFAHLMIDSGADLVFSHGPHVTRAIELYKDRFIAYSLGNFCTYAKFGLGGVLGVAPIVKVYLNKDGSFLKGKIFPIKQIKRGIPVFDESYEDAVKIVQGAASAENKDKP